MSPPAFGGTSGGLGPFLGAIPLYAAARVVALDFSTYPKTGRPMNEADYFRGGPMETRDPEEMFRDF